MTLRTATHRLLDPSRREDGAALVMALMAIFIAAMLSVAVMGTLLVQVKPTQVGRKSIRTLGSSEAGFDVALNRIRAANNTSLGILNRLPCGPIAGPVSSNTGAPSYNVSIAYYRFNPSGQPAAWLTSTVNKITCSITGPLEVPAYALLTSKGSGTDVPGTVAGQGNRTLTTVYEFQTTNQNVAGGLIHLYNQATPLCLAAGNDSNPTNNGDRGDLLYIRTCDDTDEGQIWAYTPDLHLQTVETNFCIESDSTANTQPALDDCNTSEKRQKWSFNDIGRFEGTSDNRTTNGYCFTSANSPAVNGSVVRMQQQCSGGGYDYVHTFSPEAKVGAGAAGEAVGNLVNYKHFGHCLDVTSQNLNATWLIGYPCKQRPDPTLLTWNQVFTFDTATKQYRTNSPAGAYCLQAGSTATPPTTQTRVLVKPCNTGEQYQQWTNTRSTGVYATSYEVLSKNGLCLDLLEDGPPEATNYERQWGMIVVATCDGSTEQKWNAPPNIVTARVTNTVEKTGG